MGPKDEEIYTLNWQVIADWKQTAVMVTQQPDRTEYIGFRYLWTSMFRIRPFVVTHFNTFVSTFRDWFEESLCHHVIGWSASPLSSNGANDPQFSNVHCCHAVLCGCWNKRSSLMLSGVILYFCCHCFMPSWKPQCAVHCDGFRCSLLLSALNASLPVCSGMAADSVCLVLQFVHWITCCTRVLYQTASGQRRVIAVCHETECCKYVTCFLAECDAVSFPGTCCTFLRNGNSYPHGVATQKKEVLILEQFAASHAELLVAVHESVLTADCQYAVTELHFAIPIFRFT
jgi:hypothetical protein